MKKGLPSPCTPIPPKTFIPLRAPGLRLLSRAAGLSPLLLYQSACLPLPPSFPLCPGPICLSILIDGGTPQVRPPPSTCMTHALPGWLTGRRSPLFAWPPHTSPMPVRIPCPHGGGAMESVAVRRIFRHPLWMARADKPPLHLHVIACHAGCRIGPSMPFSYRGLPFQGASLHECARISKN